MSGVLRAAAIVTAKHPAARFLIVGQAAPADEGYRAALAASVARLGLEGRVVFTGLRLDVPEILSQVSVSVLPSHSEGLSNVLLESMAAVIDRGSMSISRLATSLSLAGISLSVPMLVMP
jgi:glycosyltransferase involved in cell wall biosynthesis